MKITLKYVLLFALSSLIFLSCSDDEDPDFEDDFFGLVNVTFSGGKTGAHVLDFAYFQVINNEEFGSVFVLSGFKDGENDIETDVFITFYKPGGMVSATNYEVVEWAGDEDNFEIDKMASYVQIVENNSQTIFTGFSKSGSVTFSKASSNSVEGTFNIEMDGFTITGGNSVEITVRMVGNFDVPKLLFGS